MRRYNTRHNSVLEVIVDFVRDHLPESFEIIATISLVQSPPLTDSQTSSYGARYCNLVELTVYYETNYIQAQTRKSNKHQDLVDTGEASGFTMEVITLEVGSRGFLHLQGFKALFQLLSRCPRRDMWNLLRQSAE